MDTLLEAIDVCNVDGFCFGNYTDEEAGTGCRNRGARVPPVALTYVVAPRFA